MRTAIEEQHRPNGANWWGVALVAGTTVVCGVFAWFATWSTWGAFADPTSADEGYLLVSLREWVAQGHLYDRVFSQYGPFYYLVFGLPARLVGFDWTIAAGRATNLTLWTGASLLLGLAAWKLTTRVSFAIATQLAVFVVLDSLLNAPMHPGALLCFLLAALIANVSVLRPRCPRASDFVTGAIVAALALTKINIGGFALVALAFAVSAGLAGTRRGRWLRCATECVFIALGPLLLFSGGVERWRLHYALVYVAAAVCAVLGSRAWTACTPERGDQRVGISEMLAGMACIAVATAACSVATGTSPASLVHGVAIRPLVQPDIAKLPVEIPVGAWMWLAIVPIVALAWFRLRERSRVRTRQIGSGAVRVAGGLALVLSVFGPSGPSAVFQPDGARFVLLPLAALALVPPMTPARTLPGGAFARRLLVASAVVQSLHAYPVAGSQVAWSLFLGIVCGCVAVSDGVTELLDAGLFRAEWARRIAPLLGALLLLAVPLVTPDGPFHPELPGARLEGWVQRYAEQTRLALPGTGPQRVPLDEATTLRSVSATVRRDCDELVSYPGLNTVYLFTGLRPPTGFNTTFWSSLLSREEQADVVRSLRRADSRVCLLLFAAGADDFARGPLVGHRDRRNPLLAYMRDGRWTPIASVDEFRLWLRNPS